MWYLCGFSELSFEISFHSCYFWSTENVDLKKRVLKRSSVNALYFLRARFGFWHEKGRYREFGQVLCWKPTHAQQLRHRILPVRTGNSLLLFSSHCYCLIHSLVWMKQRDKSETRNIAKIEGKSIGTPPSLSYYFKSGPTQASFLFIFVLFKHNITETTVGFSGIELGSSE